MVFKNAVVNIPIDQVGMRLLLIMLCKIVFTKLDLPFGFLGPILGLLFTVKMIADSRVAFNADDGSPNFGTVLVRSLEDGCHLKPLFC